MTRSNAASAAPAVRLALSAVERLEGGASALSVARVLSQGEAPLAAASAALVACFLTTPRDRDRWASALLEVARAPMPSTDCERLVSQP
jgi:hypothetical protein